MAATQLVITSGNPLAPRWRMDSSCPIETPPGCRDIPFDYRLTVTAAANEFVSDAVQLLDGDGDFILREIRTSSADQWRIRDPWGNSISDELLNALDVQGPIFPTNVPWAAGERVFYDFDNSANGSPATAEFVIRGVKRMGKATGPAGGVDQYVPLFDRYSKPPKGFFDEAVSYFVRFQYQTPGAVVAAAGGIQLLNQTLSMQPDGDSYIRSIEGAVDRDYTFDSTVAFEPGIRFRDPVGRQISDEFLPVSSWLPKGRSSAEAAGAFPWFPELFAPRSSVLNFDVSNFTSGAEVSFWFRLGGVKRLPYEVCK